MLCCPMIHLPGPIGLDGSRPIASPALTQDRLRLAGKAEYELP
jgi:hypothetical protein